MPRRAIVYLLAGIICATGAVVIAQQYLETPPKSRKPRIDLTEVAVLTQSVDYAGRMVIQKTKEGSGHIRWIKWPSEHVLERFITRGEVPGEGTFLAMRPLPSGDVLREDDFRPRKNFLPEKAYIDYFRAPQELEKSLSPGQRVDVFRRREDKTLADFIRHARVLSVGEPPARLMNNEATGGKGTVGGQISIYILLHENMREDVEKVRRKEELVVKPSRYDDSRDFPELVSGGPDPRQQAIRRQLEMIDSLSEQNHHEAALTMLDLLAEEYSELVTDKEVQKRRQHSEKKLANRIWDRAQDAFKAGLYNKALEFCERLLNKNIAPESLGKKVRELSRRAREKGQKKKREEKYRRICAGIRTGIASGNLPKVKKFLEKLKANYTTYEPGPGLYSPDQILDSAQKQYREMKDDFKTDMTVIKYYIQEKNKKDALSKLREMEQRFSKHPQWLKIREKMREKGWLN